MRMAEDGIKAFWRDDVNLWIHRPAVRIAVWLGVFSGLALIAFGVYFVGKSLLPELTAYAISAGVSLVTGLGAFAGELYYEGGKSAAKLKADNASTLTTKGAERDDEVRLLRHQLATAERERDAACADRAAALAECEILRKPTKQRGNRNDVIRRFQRLVDAGKKIAPEQWSDFKNWELQMIPVVQECLEEHWANEIIQPGQDILRTQSPNEKEKAKYWLAATIAKVQGWIGALRDGNVDHCIREDFYVDVQA